MFCPGCGTKTSIEQKFCRSCGLSLEKAAQSLIEQLPTQLSDERKSRKEKLERMGVAALSVFGLGVLAMLLYGVVYKVILVQGRTWEGLAILGFLAIIASGLLAVYLFAEANDSDKLLFKKKEQRPPELATPSPTTGKLLPESDFEPLPSVTERTTELLFAEKKQSPEE
jgi:hypothetical protein